MSPISVPFPVVQPSLQVRGEQTAGRIRRGFTWQHPACPCLLTTHGSPATQSTCPWCSSPRCLPWATALPEHHSPLPAARENPSASHQGEAVQQSRPLPPHLNTYKKTSSQKPHYSKIRVQAAKRHKDCGSKVHRDKVFFPIEMGNRTTRHLARALLFPVPRLSSCRLALASPSPPARHQRCRTGTGSQRYRSRALPLAPG